MGSQVETTTQTNTVPGAGAQETGARGVLSQLAGGDLSQLDLSNLTSGNFQVSPEDRAFIEQISRLSQRAAGDSIRANATDTMQAFEDNALDRGIGGSTIEAVNKAVGMRQMQQSLDQSAISGQITSAQQLREQALSRAGIQLNANQLLLQRILGGAGQLAQLGLQERLAQGSMRQETEKPFDWGAAATLGMKAGEMALGTP